MKKLKQNDISMLRHRGLDLDPRLEKILADISSKSEFRADVGSIRKIQWWKSGKVGSASISGTFNGNEVVLKIQGSRPNTSEYEMITRFGKQNESKIIRPPKIYKYLEWNEKLQYEALIYEKASENYPIRKRPAKQVEIDKYFNLYSEYRRNCRNMPWLHKPETFDYKSRISDWMNAVRNVRIKYKSGYRSDYNLKRKAISILEKELKISDLEFVHGHFQTGDLHILSDQEVVLTSNLFWSWRNPFYDATFGYHWWMLGMEHLENLDDTTLEEERSKWFTRLFDLEEVKEKVNGEKLLNIALLERAIPALMVDRFMTDQSKPSSIIISDGTRRELIRLINLLG